MRGGAAGSLLEEAHKIAEDIASCVPETVQIVKSLVDRGLASSLGKGLQLEKPLTRMTETVALLRTMLAGEKTAFVGDTLHSKGYAQQRSDPAVPIYLAALRSNLLQKHLLKK